MQIMFPIIDVQKSSVALSLAMVLMIYPIISILHGVCCPLLGVLLCAPVSAATLLNYRCVVGSHDSHSSTV